jgi:hypothetical protein
LKLVLVGHGLVTILRVAVITPDVRFEGFTSDDWLLLGEIFRPRVTPASAGPGEAAGNVDGSRPSRSGGVVAVSTGQRLRKLVSTTRGRLDLYSGPWPEALEDLARRHGAAWVLHLHTGALEELMERFGQRLRPEHDYLAQVLLLLRILRELDLEGALCTWPRRIAAWPIPSEALVTRAFDAFCPDGRAVLLGVFADGHLATSLAARRRGAGFDWILGPDELRTEMGLVSGDWTRDYRHLARAAELRVGPLALGCFGELGTLQQLVRHTAGPGSWATAVAARDIIISPVAPAVAVPLGIDLGRAAVAAARGLVNRLAASSWLAADGTLLPALERFSQRYGIDRDIESLLGFNPLGVLRQLLSRD